MKWTIVVSVMLAGACAAQSRSLFDVKNRFLDGSIDTRNARMVTTTFGIDGFEDAKTISRDWKTNTVTKIEPSDQHVTEGKASLKVTFSDRRGVLQYQRGSQYWGNPETEGPVRWSLQLLHYDAAALDIFNPQNTDVPVVIKMGKSFRRVLKPGANQVLIDVDAMVQADMRATEILPLTEFTVESDQPVTLYVDNFHWTGQGIGENMARDARCFDAGSSEPAHVRGGFSCLTSTTPYTKDKGYGWEKPSDVEFAWDWRKFIGIPSSGRQPHDQLIRDSVVQVQSPLLVDLPNGRYRLHWVEGIIVPTNLANLPCDYSVSLRANGRLTEVRKGAKGFDDRLRYIYGRDRVDYLPGEDRWRKYMSDWFSPLEADVEVTGGQLKLEFATDPPGRANIAFLIIYPVDRAGVIEPELTRLWQQIARRFNERQYRPMSPEYASKHNIPGMREEYLDPIGAAKRHKELIRQFGAEKNVLAFSRGGMDEVYPDTVPDSKTVTDQVQTVGMAGEIASMTINLHALKDIDGLSVAVSDFAGPANAAISKAHCDLRFARYSYRMSAQQGHGDWNYMVMPWYLVKRESIAMSAAMSVRWWLNINVPAASPPGIYKSQATITAHGKKLGEVTLVLSVMPVRLDGVPKEIEFSTVWGFRSEWSATPDAMSYYPITLRMNPTDAKEWAAVSQQKTQQRVDAEFGMMKSYGLNLVYNRPALEAANLLPATMPAESTTSIKVCDIKNLSDRTYVAGDPGKGLAAMNEGEIKRCKDAGRRPVLFGPPKDWSDIQQEAGIYRFSAGFMLWRLGASGCVFDPWDSRWGDPYHPFDGHSGEWGSLCVPASHDWPTLNPSLVLEGIREGILDYRCLVTLERLIREHKDSPAAKAASAYLADLAKTISPRGDVYFAPVGDARGGWDNTWHQKDAAWRDADYSKARLKLLQLIQGFPQK